jgi:hypothetical protein
VVERGIIVGGRRIGFVWGGVLNKLAAADSYTGAYRTHFYGIFVGNVSLGVHVRSRAKIRIGFELETFDAAATQKLLLFLIAAGILMCVTSLLIAYCTVPGYP